MITEEKRNNVRGNRMKYMIYIILRPVLIVISALYIVVGSAVMYMIYSSHTAGVVATKTALICTIAYLIILICIGLLYDRLMDFLSFSTLRKIKQNIYCPACGKKHTVIIRAKSPVCDIEGYRYIYRWCQLLDRVVNIYTRFDKDYDDEVLQLNEVAADYDRIYACEYRKIRKKEMKKEDKEASDS